MACPISSWRSVMSNLRENKPSRSIRQPPKENNSAPRSGVRPWHPHLSQYHDQRILTFNSDRELAVAIDLLWSDDLRNLPHETPDGNSLVVPAEAVDFFRQAGLLFEEQRALSVSELPAEEIR